jgi:hypothetical protein
MIESVINEATMIANQLEQTRADPSPDLRRPRRRGPRGFPPQARGARKRAVASAHVAHLGPGGSHHLWRHARFDWPSVDWNHDRSPPLQRPRPPGVTLPGAPLAWERPTRRSRSPGPLLGAAPEGMVQPSPARRRTSSVTRHDAHRPDRGPRSLHAAPGPRGPRSRLRAARAHEVLR